MAMDKSNVHTQLRQSHEAFIQYIGKLSQDDFMRTKNEKWTAGQHLEHIVLAVKPVRQAFTLPRFILKMVWGKTNRESKTYEALVNKYKLKLENGGRASARFVPKPVQYDQRERIIRSLTNELKSLLDKVEKYTEEDLDLYILPHPLLGKLTLREMLYFTIYHVHHHQELAMKNFS
jgi:hypothetical protein